MLKIGVFGAWRGNSYINLFKQDEDIEIVAICDRNITPLLRIRRILKTRICVPISMIFLPKASKGE